MDSDRLLYIIEKYIDGYDLDIGARMRSAVTTSADADEFYAKSMRLARTSARSFVMYAAHHPELTDAELDVLHELYVHASRAFVPLDAAQSALRVSDAIFSAALFGHTMTIDHGVSMLPSVDLNDVLFTARRHCEPYVCIPEMNFGHRGSSRVFVTGDIHGGLSISRLSPLNWHFADEMEVGDYLVVVGDFGLYWRDGKNFNQWLDWLDAQPFTTLWVDGNHEDFDMLSNHYTMYFHGGTVGWDGTHRNVLHLLRGERYDMGEFGKWLVLGGADSPDRWDRVEHYNWWREESITESDLQSALDKVDSSITHVFTHEVPARCADKLAHRQGVSRVLSEGPDRLERLRSALVSAGADFTWYAGHWHVDSTVDGVNVLFKRIVPLSIR